MYDNRAAGLQPCYFKNGDYLNHIAKEIIPILPILNFRLPYQSYLNSI